MGNSGIGRLAAGFVRWITLTSRERQAIAIAAHGGLSLPEAE
jgi:hypothetical protein